MADMKKRKENPSQEDGGSKKFLKRAKGGTGGKWKMPHHRPKLSKIEPGDRGIWVTCAKGQERRAADELLSMFEDCAHRYYNLTPFDEQIAAADADEPEGDIESSIRDEISSLSSREQLFTPVQVDMQCVTFFKTLPPIDPVEFVYRICKEVATTAAIRRMRYVNRLTPMTLMGRATMRDLEDLAKTVIGKEFQLADEPEKDVPEHSYAIRPTFRNHNTLQRGDVIQKIASLVGPKHKVNLTKPDKVILVEVSTTICGVSIVNGDWESLKRFNLTELYARHPPRSSTLKADGSSAPKSQEASARSEGGVEEEETKAEEAKANEHA